jgi:hypothetical protein
MKSAMTTNKMGSITIQYDIAPVKIVYTYQYETLGDFLARLLQIVGGLFAVGGIIESLLRNFTQEYLSEVELGKRK